MAGAAPPPPRGPGARRPPGGARPPHARRPPPRPSAAPGGPPPPPAPRGVRVGPPWGVRVRGARPSPRRYWLLAGRTEAPLAAGARPLGAQVPAPHPSAAAPVLGGRSPGEAAPFACVWGCESPGRGEGPPFPPLLRSPPTAGATLLFGEGSGGVSSPGGKTPAPELGVPAQVSASVVTSPPGLGLDKSPGSKLARPSAQAFLPRVSRLSSLSATWASALTLEYLSLALLDALSPGSRLCPARSGCGLPLDVTPASGSSWWDC